ncbi:class I SAM-dependent methyltransferase [Thermosulfurimonas dismutans]|uniref:Methyltransferase n=1 Tax=Thermosulfurimonas dismutans TaxID=999894 RepID=A0A179D6P0_9BACT|nr:class I SAM-dependent methyltransferase [Thermosulfurimonas dismutans]OAQ21633.1 Methyltransferase [Thermosulfurimonas dismutans]
MAHVFNPRDKHKLDSPERKRRLPAEAILKEFGLRKGDWFLDIGCGTGYFTLPAGRLVGPSGKVYAVDISRELLNELKSRAEKSGLTNIECIKSHTYEIPLPSGLAEKALLAFVLHEVEERAKFLSEIRRLLKPGGQLFVLEWQKKKTDMGPPVEERLSEDEVIRVLNRVGFEILRSSSLSDWFWLLIAQKTS